MRLLPSAIVFAAAVTSHIFAQGNPDPIVTTGTIPSQSVDTTVGTPGINLQSYFAIPTITGQVVQFKTAGLTAGADTFNIEMNSTLAPNTVANFLAYVNANSFTNTLIHRSNKGYHIFQGGSYSANTAYTTFASYFSVTTNAPIAMEAADTLTHVRGTIAMARTTGPNSATSGWFINTADNSGLWAPASAQASNSYAAFGRVTGTGMSVVDTIAALPVLGGNVNIGTSATGSTSVSLDYSSVPSNFGGGWTLLGSTVVSASPIGNIDLVTLSANANETINSSTARPFSLFPSPFDELPVFTNLASAPGGAGIGTLVPLTNLVQESSVKVVPIFPATPGGPSVVTFSVVSSDPSLVNAFTSGSNLYVAAAKNLTGSATVTVTATDSNGNAVSQTPFNVSVTRKVNEFGTADGIADLVFQNSAGQIAAWYNHSSSTGASLYSGGLGDWRIVAVADWNHDGVTDLIFQNNAGQIAVWYGGLPANGATLYSGGLGDWKVVGVGDINHDGIPDLVFQNTVGQIAVWYSGLPANGAYLYGGGLGDWRVKCIADINGDGFADLLFQNTAGQIAVWYSASPATGSTIYGGGLGDWKVAGVSDINGDGVPDILFQNTIGQIAVWYSGSYLNAAYIYNGGLGDWRLR